MKQIIENLAEALILADACDLQALANIDDLFEQLSKQAAEHADPNVPLAASAARELIEKIILKQADDAQGSLDIVRQAVSSLQAIITDGRDVAEVSFPEALNLPSNESTSDSLGEQGDACHPALPDNVDEDIFSDFISRQPTNLDEIETFILTLENKDSPSKLDELLRALHTLKGEAGFMGLVDVGRLCHETEDAIAQTDPATLVDTLLEIKDWLARTFNAYAGEGKIPEPVEQVLAKLPQDNTTGPTDPTDNDGPSDQAESATTSTEEPTDQDPEQYPLTGDPELLADFIGEAKEHLEAADVHLLTIETAPDDQDAINATFRAFHTIKGVAGFLALKDIQSLAHQAEGLLDGARMGKIELTGNALDVTFDAVDLMKKLVGFVKEALSSGGQVATDPNQHKLIQRLAAAKNGDQIPASPVPELDLSKIKADHKIGRILVQAGVICEADLTEALEKQKAAEGTTSSIVEILIANGATTKNNVEEALVQYVETAQDAEEIGKILVRDGLIHQEDLEKALAHQAASTHQRVGEILVREGKAPSKAVAQALRAQSAASKSAEKSPPAPSAPAKQAAPPKAKNTPAKAAKNEKLQIKETVKVDSLRLDALIETIGELVIAEAMVNQSPELQTKSSNRLSSLLGHLNKITRELQEMATSLRMAPIGPTFQRMARLVRDVAKKTNKKVEFSMIGEETELDKTVVDQIGDPLVHMVRNAVDHGIEPTIEERRAAGKPDAGSVVLRAFHKGGNIHIELIDDGRGLDKKRILEKAVEKGLVREGETLSDREIFNLVFEPGFSTAKVVSDVSGRGVGMDVVKRNIQALRGHVEIQSEPGKGTTFSIRLPLTLAIIEGMVVRVGSRRYVLPLLSITRMLRPEPNMIRTVFERAEMLTLPDGLIPLIRLHRVFNVDDAKTNPCEAAVVVVERDGSRVGLMIDELLGQQQIVIKSLGATFKGAPGIAGGAIMPDGLVGVIIDLDSLIKLADTDRPPPQTAA